MIARNRKSGFTLVEILIVVVILGILAAIVIPQFSSASESAQASSLKSTLQTLRSQLELFQVQHNGYYPPAMEAGDDDSNGLPKWDAMLKRHGWDAGSDLSDGLQTDDLDFNKTDWGPYMQKFPANPFAHGSEDPADHWFYNADTGRIAANVTAVEQSKREGLGLEVDDEDFATSDPFAGGAAD